MSFFDDCRRGCEDLGRKIKNGCEDAEREAREAFERAAAETRRAAEQAARVVEAEARRAAEEARRIAEQAAADAQRALEAAAAEVKAAGEKAIHDAEAAAAELAKRVEAEMKAAVEAAIEQARYTSNWVSEHLKKLTDIGPLLKDAEKFGHDLGDKLQAGGIDAFDHLPKLDNLHLPSAQQIKNALKYFSHLVTTVSDAGIHVLFTPLREVAKAFAPNADLGELDRAEDKLKDGVHQVVDNIEGRLDGIVDAGSKAALEFANAYRLAQEHKWAEAAESMKAALKDSVDLALAFIPPEIIKAADFMAEKFEQAATFAAEKMAQGLKYIKIAIDKTIEIGMKIIMNSPVMLLVKLASPEAAAKIEHAIQSAADAVGSMIEGTLDAVVSVVASSSKMVGALRHGDVAGAGKAAFDGVMNAAVVGLTVIDGVAAVAEAAVAGALSDILPPEAAGILATIVTMTTPAGLGKGALKAVDNFIPTKLITDAVGSASDAASGALRAVGDAASNTAGKIGSAIGDAAESAGKNLGRIPVTGSETIAVTVATNVAASAATSGRKAAPTGAGDDVGSGLTSGGKKNDVDPKKPKDADDPAPEGAGGDKGAGTTGKSDKTDDTGAPDKGKSDKTDDTDGPEKGKSDKTDDADSPDKKKKKKKKDKDDDDLDLGSLLQPGFGSTGFAQQSTIDKFAYLRTDYAGHIGAAAASEASSGKAGVKAVQSGRPSAKAVGGPVLAEPGNPALAPAAPEPAAATSEERSSRRRVATPV